MLSYSEALSRRNLYQIPTSIPDKDLHFAEVNILNGKKAKTLQQSNVKINFCIAPYVIAVKLLFVVAYVGKSNSNQTQDFP